MLIVKLVGKKYDKEELQENSIKVRKWFAIKCIQKETLDKKHYEISENDNIEKQ